MKQKSLRRNLVWLRICITAFLLVIVSLFLFAFSGSGKETAGKQLDNSQLHGTAKIK